MRTLTRKRMVSLGAMAIAAASVIGAAETSVADGKRFQFTVWDLHTNGIWRKEVRTRTVARWFRHYNWTVDQRLWLNRRAEGVWITGRALSTFTCRAHCVIRNPIAGGTGFWRIWRTFTKVDVKRFRLHKRIWWLGHLNVKLKQTLPPPPDPLGPVARRFGLSVDQVEIVTGMEPLDPTPADGLNENVQFMDENGRTHTLGDGFLRSLGMFDPATDQELLPDTAMNPGGFQLATTAMSEDLLPPPQQRMVDNGMTTSPGMVLWAPGVWVEWLMNENGDVLKRDAAGVPLNALDPTVLGDRRSEAEIGDPTGLPGNMLPVNFAIPPKLNCWLLAPNGEVFGKKPGGPAITGPPVDEDGDGLADPNTPIGGPIPMNLTQFDENNIFNPNMAPVQFEIEEEPDPTDAELADLNARLAAQIPNFVPFQRPFALCIRRFHLRSRWGVDRRVVMDIWRHHLQWRIQHHINLTVRPKRVWLSKLALVSFRSRHHHRVVGKPPVWRTLDLTHVRFFRCCYRIHCPKTDLPKLRLDQCFATVPIDPLDLTQGFMLFTTETDVRKLPPPAVLIGLKPDTSIPFDQNGVFTQDLTEVEVGDIQSGSPETFEGDFIAATRTPGKMVEVALNGNNDDPTLMLDNQLRLHCFMLDANGNVLTESFFPDPLDPVGPPIDFTTGPTQAIPEFFDEDTGVFEPNPTMLGMTVMATDTCPSDLNNNGTIGPGDLLALLANFSQFGPGGLLALLADFGSPCP